MNKKESLRSLCCLDLYDEEDILGWVGDGEDGRARQCGDGRCLDVRTQHRFGLLRVEVKKKVLRYLRETKMDKHIYIHGICGGKLLPSSAQH